MSGIVNRMDACVHAKFNIGAVKMESHQMMMLIVGVAMMCIGAAFLHVTLNSVTSSHLLCLPAIGLACGGVMVSLAIALIFRNNRSQLAEVPAMNRMVLIEPEVEGEHCCPITQMPFERPWILLEDGFTYEYEAIQRWLAEHPNNSPMLGPIPSATLLPNCAVKKGESCCPITQERFREAYYCLEDGHTYEKEAIETWFETQMQMSLDMETSRIYIRSPCSGTELNSLTLYPNKVLFGERLPPNQQPIVIRIDEAQVLADAQSKLKNICIHDQEIRRLLKDYLLQREDSIKEQFNQRRIALGLEVRGNETWGSLDLSHLDLSHMNFDRLFQKGTILKETDLSYSVFANCCFAHCCFINCKMKSTQFNNCDFGGERVSFFESDMENAWLVSCKLERASTWRAISDSQAFKAELAARGALKSETVRTVLI